MTQSTEGTIQLVPMITLEALPTYMIVLHRLARLGKADVYQPPAHKRYVQFKLENHPSTVAKWVGLQDVESVTVIYRDPAETRSVHMRRSHAASL